MASLSLADKKRQYYLGALGLTDAQAVGYSNADLENMFYDIEPEPDPEPEPEPDPDPGVI